MTNLQKSGSVVGDWVALQRKIFSRWCKQKVVHRPEFKIVDIVTDCKDGVVLIGLIEELSEKKFPEKLPKQGSISLRIKQIELVDKALKFVWQSGVELKIKPSPEDIVDGKETSILGLIWAIMLRFIKIGDDDDEGAQKLNAKDALLMWVNNKVTSYGIEATDFKKTSKSIFHNGKAFVCIIHKHRPGLIKNIESCLASDDPLKVIETAQNAALEYFQLDKFVTPKEVTQLDENSMVIYVSEFYYGIAEQRKIDLAGRRLMKVIKLTQENDRLKAEFNKTAKDYQETLKPVEIELNDRSIDNTLGGAKNRIEKFYEYKTVDKSKLLNNQLSLESLYNNLSMRLAHHKRPEFIPPTGCTLKDVEGALKHLEEVELERNKALHEELNRQLKLAQIAKQHSLIHGNINHWVAEKKAYLETKEMIDSVSSAQFHLRVLEAYDKEHQSLLETTVAEAKKMLEELQKEKYENCAEREKSDAEVDEAFRTLRGLSDKKMPVLQDDLQRELFKQKIRLLFENHTKKFEALQKYIVNAAKYLNEREVTDTVQLANTHISLLVLFVKDKIQKNENEVNELKTLGKEINDAKYETQYSSWVFEKPDEVTARHKTVDSEFLHLDELAEKKKKVLDDHLAREEFRAKVNVLIEQHVLKHSQLISWIAQKEKYLTTFSEVHNVEEATTLLTLFDSYVKERQITEETNVKELMEMGKKLRESLYSSEYSSYRLDCNETTQPTYKSDHPENVQALEDREQEVTKRMAEMVGMAEKMKKVLEDHLQREEYAETSRVIAVTYNDKAKQIEEWIKEKEAYLRKREYVNSVQEAYTQLALLQSFIAEKEMTTMGVLGEMKAIGKDLLARKYETNLSQYEYEKIRTSFPEYSKEDPSARQAVLDADAYVDKKWKELDELRDRLKAILDDHMTREEFANLSRTMAVQHLNLFTKLKQWIQTKETFLLNRPIIRNVSEVSKELVLMEAYAKERERVTQTDVAELLKTGRTLLERKHETEFSYYIYEHTKYNEPEYNNEDALKRKEISEHEAWLKTKWVELEGFATTKLRILNDHLQREKYAEKVRVLAKQHLDMFEKINGWISEKEKFLKARETVKTVLEAQTHLQLLEQYHEENKTMTKTTITAFNSLGGEIKDSKYSSEYSSYVYEHTQYNEPPFNEHLPEKLTKVEENMKTIEILMKGLENEAEERKKVLDDHLQREIFAADVRLLDRQHFRMFDDLAVWYSEKKKYLEERPLIDSISDAQKQLALLQTFEQEMATTTNGSVMAMKKMTENILPKKYESNYSSFVVENPEELKGRDSDIDVKWKDLEVQRNALKAYLDEANAREIEKERLRLEFAHLALELTKYVENTKNKLTIEVFGYDLEEVQAHSTSIQETTARIKKEAENQQEELKKTKEAMDKIGVKENIYSKTTLEDISKMIEDLQKAIENRNKNYQKELERQIFNDKLCQKFASLVDPFAKWISEQKEGITKGKGSLEIQLKQVDALLASLPEDSKKMNPIREVAEQLKQAGVTNIRHTSYTLRDVEVQFSQYTKFLEEKKKMIEFEIENARLKGITAEQLKEIEENFVIFDKDKNGVLDRVELTACLYSLGEEKPNSEIKKIMEKYGEKGMMSLERFKTFMVDIMGDADTKDEVLQSFVLINRDNDVAHKDRMAVVVPEQGMKFFEQTAPKKGDGYDFKAWTDDIYNR